MDPLARHRLVFSVQCSLWVMDPVTIPWRVQMRDEYASARRPVLTVGEVVRSDVTQTMMKS